GDEPAEHPAGGLVEHDRVAARAGVGLADAVAEVAGQPDAGPGVAGGRDGEGGGGRPVLEGAQPQDRAAGGLRGRPGDGPRAGEETAEERIYVQPRCGSAEEGGCWFESGARGYMLIT